MNVLEKYAASCGVKISEPTVSSSYFPLPYDKYIVIDNRNKNGMNVYDLYFDVIAYLKPILEKQGIGIISFVQDEKSVIKNTRSYISLSKKQEAYILRNSLLNICSDNLSSYISSALDVPCISLYTIYPAETNRPLWSNKHQCIESDRCGNLPSYGLSESPKTINFISPEEIVTKTLAALSIDEKIKYKTIYTGDNYAVKAVEVIPDFAVEPAFMKGRALNIRLDYHFDEQNLYYWLQGRYLNILIDKPIDINIIKAFKKNVAQITANINDSFSENYFKTIQQLGIKVEIFCENKEQIQDFRFKFFDFNVNESIWKSKDDLDCEITNKTKFISNKVLLSEGKKYSCFEAKKRGNELTDELEMVYDTQEFWKELDHYRLIHEL